MSNEERRERIEQDAEVLRNSTDPGELEAAAARLAASDDPEALDRLGGFLSQNDFLERLDNVSEPAEKVLHLRNVLAPFVEQPSPEVAALCLRLAGDPVFLSEDDRTPLLLEALAKVRPMSEATVEFFRRTNEEGYFSANAPRLVANGSPPALALFVAMLSNREVDIERRIDLLHMSIVPQRTRLSTLQMTSTLLGCDLEEEVARAAIESVFDFQWQWFGSRPPEPPAWRTADIDTLQYLIKFGEANTRAGLPESTQEAIQWTIGVARALLARRERL